MASYDNWALRLDEAIKRRPDAALAGNPETLAVEALLLLFANEAAAIVGAIARNITAVAVDGNDRLAALEGFLAEMIPHREFPLLEYRYMLAGGEQPGLRLRVDLTDEPGVISAQHFEDLRRWRDQPASREQFTMPITFALAGDGFIALPHPDFSSRFASCTSWQAALRETLALPFRHLYDAAMTAS